MRPLIRVIVTAFATLLAIATTADAATYRAASLGIEVRVREGIATVTYADPVCGLRTARPMRVRRGRFRRRASAVCELSLNETRSSDVVVAGRITRSSIRGRVGKRRFLARRGAPRPTRAQRCALRGATRAETALVRVFAEDLRTVACRRSDGFGVEIAQVVYDDARYYASGIDARFVKAICTRIAYASAPIDTARSKYGQDPGFETDIVVRDLLGGPLTRTRAEVFTVSALALRDDGAVAWTGSPASRSFRDVLVQTVRDGEVVTLDRGPIDPRSLRVVDGEFVWDR